MIREEQILRIAKRQISTMVLILLQIWQLNVMLVMLLVE